MNEKKYFPTIFIGLGGSGSKTIKFLREILLRTPETRDLVDEQFVFAAADTDVEDLGQSGIREENRIKTSENVNVARYLEDKRDENDSDFFSWWPADTGMLNTKPLDKGAGQIRITSRLGFHYQMENNNLKEKINAILTRVQGITSKVDTSDTMLRVYIISSIAGGTGSALFTMMGYLVRELLRGRKIDMRAVLMMPEVFCQGSQEPSLFNRIRANGYASLKELEAAISFADSAREYVDYVPPFNYLALKDFQANLPEYAERYLTERPYDWCVLFDKTRDSGVPFERPGPGYENYYREIAHCLYMQVFSPNAAKAGSAEDNFINSLLKAVKAGDKSKRYSSFGFSALIFPREDFALRLTYEYLDSIFGEQGYWLKADEDFKRRKAEAERDKFEGKAVPLPRRHEVFISQVRTLASSTPQPFRGIVYSIDGNPENKAAPLDYDQFWSSLVGELQRRYDEEVLQRSLGNSDGLESHVLNNLGSYDDEDQLLSLAEQLRKGIETFRKSHVQAFVDEIFSPKEERSKTYLFTSLLSPSNRPKRSLFELRYLASRLFCALEVLSVHLATAAKKLEDFPGQLEQQRTRHGKVNRQFYPAVFALNKKGIVGTYSNLLGTYFGLPREEGFTAYKLSLYDGQTVTRTLDERITVAPDMGWSTSLGFLSILSTVVELSLEKLQWDPERPAGLLNSIHVLFDNMGDLRRQFASELESVKHSGRHEDLIYPDNSKIKVYCNQDAIDDFKQEILKMDSDKVLGEFNSAIQGSVLENWQKLLAKQDDLSKQSLLATEISRKMKDEAQRMAKSVVNDLREDIAANVKKEILRHPALDISLSVALEREARRANRDTDAEIREYKKDRIKAAYGLSKPFIRLSKGDSRVETIAAYSCTNKVNRELGSLIGEYVKEFGEFPPTEHDKPEDTFDNRILFYQSYLAFDLGKVENLFSGNGSLKSAYYQELRDSAITTHIHKDWTKELEDLDSYFNQQIRAFFLLWLSLGTRASSSGHDPVLYGDGKSSVAATSSVWKGWDLDKVLDGFSERFTSEGLKVGEGTSLSSIYKAFRVNFGLSEGVVSRKRIEEVLTDAVQEGNSDWQVELSVFLSLIHTYLNRTETKKTKTSVFLEQFYNSTLAFAQRCDDNLAWAEGFKQTCGRFETFFWPLVS